MQQLLRREVKDVIFAIIPSYCLEEVSIPQCREQETMGVQGYVIVESMKCEDGDHCSRGRGVRRNACRNEHTYLANKKGKFREAK